MDTVMTKTQIRDQANNAIFDLDFFSLNDDRGGDPVALVNDACDAVHLYCLDFPEQSRKALALLTERVMVAVQVIAESSAAPELAAEGQAHDAGESISRIAYRLASLAHLLRQ